MHGEGVFIEFNRDSIDAWLRDPELGDFLRNMRSVIRNSVNLKNGCYHITRCKVCPDAYIRTFVD